MPNLKQKDKDTAIPLGLENVVGIFYTLIIGCAIATFFAILDFLLEVRKQCKVHKVRLFYIKDFIILQIYSASKNIFHSHLE